MKAADKQGSPATCGCANTGSETVFIEGKGAVRVGFDHATGTIRGGIGTVTVEGQKISVVHDPVDGHGSGPHGGPFTAHPAGTVFVGEGHAHPPPPPAPEVREGRTAFVQERGTTGGIAAARMILAQRTGQPASEAAVAEVASRVTLRDAGGQERPFFDPQHGTDLAGLPAFLGLSGIPAHTVDGPLTPELIRTSTAQGGGPLVVSRAEGALVIDGLDPAGNVLARDPQRGFVTLPPGELHAEPGAPITVVGSPPAGHTEPLTASLRGA